MSKKFFFQVGISCIISNEWDRYRYKKYLLFIIIGRTERDIMKN